MNEINILRFKAQTSDKFTESGQKTIDCLLEKANDSVIDELLQSKVEVDEDEKKYKITFLCFAIIAIILVLIISFLVAVLLLMFFDWLSIDFSNNDGWRMTILFVTAFIVAIYLGIKISQNEIVSKICHRILEPSKETNLKHYSKILLKGINN